MRTRCRERENGVWKATQRGDREIDHELYDACDCIFRDTRGNRDNYGAVAYAFPFEWLPFEGTPVSEASFRLELGREDLIQLRNNQRMVCRCATKFRLTNPWIFDWVWANPKPHGSTAPWAPPAS